MTTPWNYQPQPQYSPLPQFQGAPGTPPTVQRAVVLMRVGAGVKGLEVILSLFMNTTGLSSLGSAWLGGLVGVALWNWMAFKNSQGKNWARVTGTVFFGIATLGLLVDLLSINVVDNNFTPFGLTVPAVFYILIACDAVNWLIGLFATILLWQKASGAFYNPPANYAAGWGIPGAPGGYPYPAPYQQGQQIPGQQFPGQQFPGQQDPGQQFPGQQPGQGFPPGQLDPATGLPVQPADPWATPNE